MADVDIHTGPAPPLNIPHCRESERERVRKRKKGTKGEKRNCMFYFMIIWIWKKKKKSNSAFNSFSYVLFHIIFNGVHGKRSHSIRYHHYCDQKHTRERCVLRFFFKNLLIPSLAVLLDSVRHSMRSLQSKNELENIKPREDRKDFRYNPTKVNPDILWS